MRKPGDIVFPDPRDADAHGLVAITPTLTPELVLAAYAQGIFPWSDKPARWYSPDPRAVFVPERVRLPRRLGRMVRKERFVVTLDTAFTEVMRACRAEHAHEGEWIGEGFVRVYSELHERGYAHSVEVWQDGALVGGLYGIQLGGLFAGESMFHRVSNASKVAFAYLLGQLQDMGTVLIDAQVLNDHTEHLGAVCVSREEYLSVLPRAIAAPCKYVGEKWPREPVGPGVRTLYDSE